MGGSNTASPLEGDAGNMSHSWVSRGGSRKVIFVSFAHPPLVLVNQAFSWTQLGHHEWLLPVTPRGHRISISLTPPCTPPSSLPVLVLHYIAQPGVLGTEALAAPPRPSLPQGWLLPRPCMGPAHKRTPRPRVQTDALPWWRP